MKCHGKWAVGWIGCGLVLWLAGSSAQADTSEAALQFEASNDAGTATLRVPFKDGTWDEQRQRFTWELTESTTLIDPKTEAPIATLKSARLRFFQGEKPRITLDFAVEAGDSTTSFVATPARLKFKVPEGYQTEANARASVGVVDRNEDGVSLQSLGKRDSGVFIAQYNGAVPNGVPFINLIGGMSAGPGGSGSVSQNQPSSGYELLQGNVTDLSCQIRLSLTARDTAEGSARYAAQFRPSGPLP